MATLRQIEANRRNAQKSTGPRTPEGKAGSRLNALRHGLRARTVLLPGESQEEFDRLCDDLESEWQPKTRTELFYLEQMAVSQWKLARTEIAEKSIFAKITDPEIQIPMLDRIWQCQIRFERSFARAQRELKRLLSLGGHPIPVEEEEEDDKPPRVRRAPVLVLAASPAKPANTEQPIPAPQPVPFTEVAPADRAGVYR